jgi:hypothetical protein
MLRRAVLMLVGFGVALTGWALVLSVLLVYIGLPMFIFGAALMQSAARPRAASRGSEVPPTSGEEVWSPAAQVDLAPRSGRARQGGDRAGALDRPDPAPDLLPRGSARRARSVVLTRMHADADGDRVTDRAARHPIAFGHAGASQDRR